MGFVFVSGLRSVDGVPARDTFSPTSHRDGDDDLERKRKQDTTDSRRGRTTTALQFTTTTIQNITLVLLPPDFFLFLDF